MSRWFQGLEERVVGGLHPAQKLVPQFANRLLIGRVIGVVLDFVGVVSTVEELDWNVSPIA
jgi:hypothetical protein